MTDDDKPRPFSWGLTPSGRAPQDDAAAASDDADADEPAAETQPATPASPAGPPPFGSTQPFLPTGATPSFVPPAEPARPAAAPEPTAPFDPTGGFTTPLPSSAPEAPAPSGAAARPATPSPRPFGAVPGTHVPASEATGEAPASSSPGVPAGPADPTPSWDQPTQAVPQQPTGRPWDRHPWDQPTQAFTPPVESRVAPPATPPVESPVAPSAPPPALVEPAEPAHLTPSWELPTQLTPQQQPAASDDLDDEPADAEPTVAFTPPRSAVPSLAPELSGEPLPRPLEHRAPEREGVDDPLSQLFAEEQFVEYDDQVAALPSRADRRRREQEERSARSGRAVPAAAVAGAGGFGATASATAAPGALAPGAAAGGGSEGRTPRILLIAAAGVVAVLVLVVLFVVGTRTGGAAPSPAPAASGTSTSTAPASDPTEPAAPGTHAWTDLTGGECLDGFTDAWQQTFSVVDCASSHTAQLVVAGTFDDASYPGTDEIAKRLTSLCTSGDSVSYSAAGEYTDLQWQASYPATQQAWDDGQRGWYCFWSRSGGGPIGADLAKQG